MRDNDGDVSEINASEPGYTTDLHTSELRTDELLNNALRTHDLRIGLGPSASRMFPIGHATGS
jgi:hypothetical protein